MSSLNHPPRTAQCGRHTQPNHDAFARGVGKVFVRIIRGVCCAVRRAETDVAWVAVLEWVSIYWFSRAGPAASVRIYYEMTGGHGKSEEALARMGKVAGPVPVGLSYFPRELFHVPKWYVAAFLRGACVIDCGAQVGVYAGRGCVRGRAREGRALCGARAARGVGGRFAEDVRARRGRVRVSVRERRICEERVAGRGVSRLYQRLMRGHDVIVCDVRVARPVFRDLA